MQLTATTRVILPARIQSGALAWSVAGFALLLASTQLPLAMAAKFGQLHEARMLSGVIGLAEQGHVLLAALVLVCGIVAPFVVLAGIAAVATLPNPRGGAALREFVRRVEPWSMPEVRLLAMIIALVKLRSELSAETAAGLWCYGAAAVCALAASRALGQPRDEATSPPWLRGRAAAAACSVGALLLLVPAYTLPVMTLTQLGRVQTDTIFSGVINLWQSGLWGLALIVFTASLIVPLLKLAGVAVLLTADRRPAPPRPGLGLLHRVVHGIGRWSMLDVFLVAFLCGLVRFGTVAAVDARPGMLAFAGAVVLTMLATAALDGARFAPAVFSSSPTHA